MTFGELEAYYKVYSREKWYYGGNIAFYSNANIKPTTPYDFIPSHLKPPKQLEMVSEEQFLSELRAIKASRKH